MQREAKRRKRNDELVAQAKPQGRRSDQVIVIELQAKPLAKPAIGARRPLPRPLKKKDNKGDDHKKDDPDKDKDIAG